MKLWTSLLAVLVLLSAAGIAKAAPVDPAADAKNKSEENADNNGTEEEGESNTSAGEEERTGTHSWDAPAIRVEGHDSDLREEDRIGSYGMPRWAARRRFNRCRIYVRPEGQFEFEFWSIHEVPRRSNHGSEAVGNEWQFEAEFGLPYRFQFDLYLIFEKSGNFGALEPAEIVTELRWAPLDWGVIYTNPTLYLEYAFKNGKANKIEAKVLLGDEIVPRVHWGANLVYEHSLGGDHENTFGLVLAVSFTVIDEILSVGWEHQTEIEDSAEDRGTYTDSHITGPSIQIRPLPQMHINIVPLIGIGGHSPGMKLYMVLGWEF
ncbi:MAG: hypothetical protein KDB82_09260 [Planctomycetes bacterium]|nr:hypothetical protein [Planctomycetota bacterium]